MAWRAEEVVSAAAEGLAGFSAGAAAEESPRGLDSLGEVALHGVLAAGFRTAGWGVLPEAPYPNAAGQRGWRSERTRCDLVLTPTPGQALIDPMIEAKARQAAAGTLFEGVDARRTLPPAPSPGEGEPDRRTQSDERCPAGEAFWLEVKAVGQFTYTLGVPGPNRTYSGELLAGIAADAAKLLADSHIRHGGVLLVLFAADRRTVEHDAAVAVSRCIDRGLPVATPASEIVPIPDLIGNAVAAAVLMPVRTAAFISLPP